MTEMQRMNFKMPKKMHAWFKERGKELGIPMSAVIVMALETHIEQKSAMVTLDKMHELAQIEGQHGRIFITGRS
jgi:hypothetical protein